MSDYRALISSGLSPACALGIVSLFDLISYHPLLSLLFYWTWTSIQLTTPANFPWLHVADHGCYLNKTKTTSQHSVPYDLQLEILMLIFSVYLWHLKSMPHSLKSPICIRNPLQQYLRGCPNQHDTLPYDALIIKIFLIYPMQHFCTFLS